MKKIISTILLGSLFALGPIVPNTEAAAFAAPESDWIAVEEWDDVEIAELATGGGSVIKPCPAGTFRVRRNTRTKKKVINSLIAGGIGTAIGAGVGGKRGALIGAGSGAGGYLVYRYVRDRRGRCVRSYR
jgi:hypothetical protein